MTGTVHILAGAALGCLSGSRLQAVVSGFLSHLILDSLPHGDLDLKGEAVLLTLAAALILPRCRYNEKALLGAVAAAAPDFENALCRLGRIDLTDMRYPSHSGLVPHGPRAATITGQAAIAVAALWVLSRKGVVK